MAAIQENLFHRLQNLNMSGSLDARPPSALARGVQITEFKDSRVNPEPIVLEDSEVLLEQYLSPGKLKMLTGVQNLESVASLEMKVDTSDTSLGNFGSLLPNLIQLRLSNSIIPCVRDLGSSLRGLEVLWMSRCGLIELDGISSMVNLRELYLSYNEIADLSPLSLLDTLEIVDLEGNNLDDIGQVEYLSMCHSLKHLTLEGNPLCVQPSAAKTQDNYDYRQEVKKIIPHLKHLDDEPLTNEPSPTKKTNVFDEDWAYIEELQNDIGLNSSMDSLHSSGADSSRPGSAAVRPSTGYRPGSALRPSSGFRPLTTSMRPATVSNSGRPSTSRPMTASLSTSNNEGATVVDASSDLTLGKVICGNPSKALLSRRKLPIQQEKEATAPNIFPELKHRVEHTYDDVDDERDRSEIMAELKEWKIEHEKRMKKIQESRAAQVLFVEHDDAVSLSSDDEEELSDNIVSDEEDFTPLEGAEGGESFNPAEDPVVIAFKSGRRHISDQHDESQNVERSSPDFRKTQILERTSPDSQKTEVSRPPLRPLKHPRAKSPVPGVPPTGSMNFLRRPADRQQPLNLEGRSQPVLRNPSESGVPLGARPSTARAILQPSLPSQQRIRRQLPSVPSLPSRPFIPK